MNSFVKKNHFISLYVGLVVTLMITIFGATYAFLSSSANNTNINGTNYEFRMALDVTPLKVATALIPINDTFLPNVMDNANVCVDSNGYEVCSLYQLNITNSSSSHNLAAYVQTLSSGYTTNNLRVGLYTKNGSVYTSVTDTLPLSVVANTKNHFTSSNNTFSFSIANGTNTPVTKTYYLAFWLHETNASATAGDLGKNFSGKIVFYDVVNGENITAQFSS